MYKHFYLVKQVHDKRFSAGMAKNVVWLGTCRAAHAVGLSVDDCRM